MTTRKIQPVRYVCHTQTTKVDRDGNSYHVCTITPTRNKFKSVTFIADGRTNGANKLRKLLDLSFDQVLALETTISASDYKWLTKNVDLYEYELTAQIIRRGSK